MSLISRARQASGPVANSPSEHSSDSDQTEEGGLNAGPSFVQLDEEGWEIEASCYGRAVHGGATPRFILTKENLAWIWTKI